MNKRPLLNKIIGVPLGYFNWIITPIKLILMLVLGLISKIFEPYDKDYICCLINKEVLDAKAKKFEDRLNTEFSYRGYTLCETRGSGGPDGENHYVSDWCLWNGVYVGMLCDKYKFDSSDLNLQELKYAAKQYTDSWVDDEGCLLRGWTWKGDYHMKKYQISLDQVSGFIYAMSKLPTNILVNDCGAKLIKLINKFIKDKYEFINPTGFERHDTNCRLSIMSTGVHAAIAMSMFLLGNKIAVTEDYMKHYKKYVRQSGGILCLIPIVQVFEKVRGFNFNITLLSLCALRNLKPTTFNKLGIKWINWNINKTYNLWWMLLCDLHVNTKNDQNIYRYLLNSFDEMNYRDYVLDTMPFPYKTKKLFGETYISEILPLNLKKGDAFLLQSTWRREKDYGVKGKMTLRNNHKYNMLTYLAPYYIMKVINKGNKSDE